MERDRVIGLFYEAAVNPSLWPRALAAYSDAAGVDEAHLAVRDPAQDICVVVSGGRLLTPEVMKSYFAYYHEVDPLRKIVGAHRDGDLILCVGQYLTEEFINKSEFYQDYAIPAGTRYMAAFTFNNTNGVLTMHTRRAPFEREKLERRAGVMGRHGGQAAKLALQFAANAARGETLRHAIDHERIACFMTDSESRLLECSDQASLMIERGNPFRLGQGLLTLTSDSRTKQFRELVAKCAAGTGGGMMRVGNLNDYWLIEVVPAGVTSDNPFDLRRGNCALVFVRKPEARPPVDTAKIRIFLDCTPVESEIGAALLNGCSPAEIANERKVSLNTVRTQIRSLLETAGVTRIPELMSLLSRLG